MIPEPDRMVLELLEPLMSDLGYAMVVAKVAEAGSISALTDSVALMELEVAKRKFGSRSEAGRYAAEVRWERGRAPQVRDVDVRMPVRPTNMAGEIRVGVVGGESAEYLVQRVKVGDVKVGDLVSSGWAGNPHRVIEVLPRRDGKASFRTETVTGDRRIATTEAHPNTRIQRWTKAGESSGAMDPSRRIDMNRVDARSKTYIEGGKTPQERIRRRNEVIDWYASRGQDVTPSKPPKKRGGKQWLLPD